MNKTSFNPRSKLPQQSLAQRKLRALRISEIGKNCSGVRAAWLALYPTSGLCKIIPAEWHLLVYCVECFSGYNLHKLSIASQLALSTSFKTWHCFTDLSSQAVKLQKVSGVVGGWMLKSSAVTKVKLQFYRQLLSPYLHMEPGRTMLAERSTRGA